MTSNHDANPSTPHRTTAPLTEEVLQQWKTEIREFFVTTEQKLRHAQTAGTAEKISLPSLTPERIASEGHVLQERPLQTSRASVDALGTQHELSAEDDSLDRLQMIKRRLAAQLENSRR